MGTTGRRNVVRLGGTLMAFAVVLVSNAMVHAERAGQEHRSAADTRIEKTKEKGFDGVDFSYDLFGGPPGQSAA